ncbi:cupin domain-containing protein [Tianweitania sediminis]|uniref:Cupin n=1 Tax=Tianweitania sediminis TaxID=1502156 RepID=A0A8J7RLQ2_9HYPH|nr:cupin domain-containing protein [Tianweitania sediminis]MBP0438039.1 cupin [Tianweitania sediminis]
MALKHAKAMEVVDVSPLGDALRGSKTHAIVKTASFEAIRLILPEGAVLPAHKVPGELTLHCLEGRVEIRTEGRSLELAAGCWIFLEGDQVHSVEGLQDSSLLLTIMLTR